MTTPHYTKKDKYGILIRNIQAGRISNTVVGNALVPANSVSNSCNVAFDYIIGQGEVRGGSFRLGAAIADGQKPLGLTSYVNQSDGQNSLFAVFRGASSSTLYYFLGGIWAASTLVGRDNDAKNRFSILGGKSFIVNGVDPMMSTSTGISWQGGAANECITPTQTMTISNPDGTYIVGETISDVAGNTAIVVGVQDSLTLILNNIVLVNAGFSGVITGSQSTATSDFVSLSSAGPAIIPYLVIQAKSRLLVVAPTDRIYFSSVVDLTQNPFITWNTDQTTGDWIDVNPDDGQKITALLNISNTVLVFKTNNMYRFNAVSATIDTDNVYNVGAVSQEATTLCQGLGYFYSGDAVYSTDGTAPQQISRIGVEDFLQAIPFVNQQNVCMGSDTANVYVSIGQVTVQGRTYKNCVLKYSVYDQSWSIHDYAKQAIFFAQFLTNSELNGETLCGATMSGDVIQFETGTTDDGVPIFYFLDTQELENENRAHVKAINDEMVVFTRNGENSQMYQSSDGKDFQPIKGPLTERVTILDDMHLEYRFIKFRWMGTSSNQAPIFEGIQIENIVDQGTQSKQT